MKGSQGRGEGKAGEGGVQPACREQLPLRCGRLLLLLLPRRQVTRSARADTWLSAPLLLVWNLGAPSTKWARCGLKEWENEVPASLKLLPRVLYTPTSNSEAQYDHGLRRQWGGIVSLWLGYV